MMKKKLLATLLCLSMAATTFAGATVVSAAEEEHEPVELNRTGSCKLLFYHDGFLYCGRYPGTSERLYR